MSGKLRGAHDDRQRRDRATSFNKQKVEYPELGMEAIWRIEVEDFPAFIVVDDKGNDFFAEFMKPGTDDH